MLSNKKIVCPNNLINVAKKKGTIDAAIVNAGEIFPMESVHKAVKQNLINPIFIGDENEIKKYADKLKWNISNYMIINEKDENNTAPIFLAILMRLFGQTIFLFDNILIYLC